MIPLKTEAPAKRKNGQRVWTEAQRAAQAEIARQRKPWLKSTGPKTEQGRKRSSRNAFKHGMKSMRTIQFKRIMRKHKAFLRMAAAFHREERRRKREFCLTYFHNLCLSSPMDMARTRSIFSKKFAENAMQSHGKDAESYARLAMKALENPALAKDILSPLTEPARISFLREVKTAAD